MENENIYIDLDGVIDEYDNPDKEMIELIKAIQTKGFSIILFGAMSEDEIRRIAAKHGVPCDNGTARDVLCQQDNIEQREE